MTRRMQLVSVGVVVIASLPLLLVGDELISLWTGQSLDISTTLVAGLACWWISMALLSPIFMVQNGAGLVRPQLIGWGAYGLLSIPAKAYVAAHLGVQFVPWTGVAILWLTAAPAAIRGYLIVMRDITTKGPRPLSAPREVPTDV